MKIYDTKLQKHIKRLKSKRKACGHKNIVYVKLPKYIAAYSKHIFGDPIFSDIKHLSEFEIYRQLPLNKLLKNNKNCIRLSDMSFSYNQFMFGQMGDDEPGSTSEEQKFPTKSERELLAPIYINEDRLRNKCFTDDFMLSSKGARMARNFLSGIFWKNLNLRISREEKNINASPVLSKRIKKIDIVNDFFTTYDIPLSELENVSKSLSRKKKKEEN